MGAARKRVLPRSQAGPGRVAQKLLAAKGGSGGGGGGGAVNAFDAVGNRKAKFEVLNKRAKGQVRNVSKYVAGWERPGFSFLARRIYLTIVS